MTHVVVETHRGICLLALLLKMCYANGPFVISIGPLPVLRFVVY